MKKQLLTILRKEMNTAIESAKKMIDESAEMYASTMVLLELGMLKGEEEQQAKEGIEILIIQGRLARRTIEVLEETIEEINELIGEESEEDAEVEIDAETMAEVLKLFSR